MFQTSNWDYGSVLVQIRTLHHDNLTRFVGMCVEPGNISLLVEYCPKGSLQVKELLYDCYKNIYYEVSLIIIPGCNC